MSSAIKLWRKRQNKGDNEIEVKVIGLDEEESPIEKMKRRIERSVQKEKEKLKMKKQMEKIQEDS
jgi:hypothetical protein